MEEFKKLADVVASVENGDTSSMEKFVQKLFELKVINMQDVYDVTQEYEIMMDALLQLDK